MSQNSIKDYLRTQGVKLPIEMVQVAYLTLGTVYNVAEVKDLPQNLWQDTNHDFDAISVLTQSGIHNDFLRSVYAVLDSTFQRYPAKVALYVVQPEVEGLVLNRFWHNGMSMPQSLNADEHGQWLLHRVAQTGWGQLIEDAQRWVNIDEMNVEESHLGLSQMLWPLTTPSGAVLGVLYVTSPEAAAFDENAQAWWLGAALTVADALYNVFPPAGAELED